MKNLGFKQLNKENWLKPDRISSSFIQLSQEEKNSNISAGEKYLEIILEPKLSEKVPIEVRKLFEVARGALIYGFFFYPLYTLACEQLFRIAETALTYRCELINIKESKKKFESKIDFLAHEKLIAEEGKNIWHALRKLRNYASHPEDQSIMTPGQVIGILGRITEDINRLFKI